MKKFKLTKAKEKEWREDWNERNIRLKQQHQPKITFEEYVENRLGKKKVTQSTCKIPEYKNPRETTHHPSLDTMECHTGKQESNKYNGARKLVGIGTMHKSNMVPIFSEDEAEDISNMRRN